jgi:hypothetical protein
MAYKNLGLEEPKRKGGSPPPPFGRKVEPVAAVAKVEPVAVVGKVKGPPRKPPGIAQMSAQEEPEEAGMQTMPMTHTAIPPEAVSYRTEAETCANCTHMERDGNCARLDMPVGQGDSCNLFEDRGETEEEAPMEEEEALT